MNEQESSRITCKVVYILKRLTDEWFGSQLCHSVHTDFNNAHLPLLMSIGTTGTTNNKLANKLNVSKQAASKSIKELEEIGLVRSERCSTDARSVMLYLTGDGEKFYQHVYKQVMSLEEQYKKVVGAKNYEIAIDVMLKLIDFHEQMNKMEAPVAAKADVLSPVLN